MKLQVQWNARLKLRAEGAKLWAEGDKLWAARPFDPCSGLVSIAIAAAGAVESWRQSDTARDQVSRVSSKFFPSRLNYA